MKLTVRFDCETDPGRDTERSISVHKRDADDLDFVLRHWKLAYETATGSPPRVVLTSPIPDPNIDADDISVIDTVDYDEADDIAEA